MEVRTSGGDLDSTTLTNIHYGGHPEKNHVSRDIIRTSLKPPPPPMDIVRRNGFFWECLAFASIGDLDSLRPTEVRLALCERLDVEEDEIPAI